MFQPPPKGDSRPVLLMNKPTCSVPPAAQTPKSPAVTEAPPPPPPAPVVQQGQWSNTRPDKQLLSSRFSSFLLLPPVVCSVAPTPPPRPALHPATQTAVRSSAPKQVLTVRPPTASCTPGVPAHPTPNSGSIMPQRVLLSPDMQARLPCE